MTTPWSAAAWEPSCWSFDDLELVGEAGSGEEAVRLCDRLRPDVVLMDLVMPAWTGRRLPAPSVHVAQRFRSLP